MSHATRDGSPVDRTFDTFDLSTFSDTFTLPSAPGPQLPPGMRVGPYEIEREIGRGGMGTVYLAFRADAAFENIVAIKVTTGALASAEAVERFKRERQILARLEHPTIARLIDGGATSEGLPYLVMELIDGQPLHVYCDQKQPGPDARRSAARQALAELYEKWKKPAEAARYRRYRGHATGVRS